MPKHSKPVKNPQTNTVVNSLNKADNATKLGNTLPSSVACAGCSWTCMGNCSSGCVSVCTSCTGCVGCSNSCSGGCTNVCTSCSGCSACDG